MYSYKQGRKCLNCNAAIADQVHAARKFCPRVKLEDGSVLSCKDDYNFQKNKSINEPFKRMGNWQKYFHIRLKQLFEKEGNEVNLELLNRYGINLNRPFQFEIKDKQYIFYYHEFAVKKITDKLFKIFKHGLF